MAAGITIPITSDGSGFAAGVKSGVLKPLDETVDALQDVDRTATRASDELVDGFRAAQSETKELERDNRDLARTIQAEARKSSRAVKDIGDDGFRSSGDAVRGFKDEAIQNFSEVASSFDGSIQGAVDGVQGTLGGLATAISGPVGLALGGLGLIAGTVATTWALKAEEIAADWQEMYDDMVESGENFLSQDLINQRIQEIAANQGQVNDAVSEGKSIGVDYVDVIRAQAGDMEALGRVYTSARDALQEQNAAQDEFIAKNGDESAAIADKQGQLELLVEKYYRMIGAQDGAATAAGIARAAMDESASANNRTADSLDRVASSANSIPGDKTVKVYADTAAFDAEMERIRRNVYQTTAEVTWQHRGRQLE
jgi:hypothetical protein